ncbi:Surfeit locus 1 family protein [Sphingopyxis sp. H038]|uniref:SURF1 family protein n=1 Tax=unclassified Sphingopyxis TaxID=2614943 RepID=UPI0007313B84|nr:MULTISPECIES: SURF1 family protein [unclassified Sphingopyxis]KTE04356.1 Surfeit locus 1 family protein [Sphingopyxis sp. H012]KTE10805.1 Surfeit locus 1 family protein [Sphingopyxis sp. H093]KTE13443.1 Surfeit locus 1 family protein [Sphingopyxis sp. H053]KTE31283.1 Surfeit locus 1 family protein [Sphingopyxis sp. H080]KTE36846.1 Surfeit locus 1 family protein [Sphingopyxis sp. H038]
MTRTRRAAFAAAALIAAVALAALGVWQLERRVWKHELVAAVEARIHAAPVAAPWPSAWDAVDAKNDAYLRVTATGQFRHDRETLVQAVTDRGPGFWVLTPLETPGFTLLVNRGFVPKDRRDAAARAAGNVAGSVTVTGLLRITEPEGAFLRSNDPAADRWFSRDVAAIAKARGLQGAAPYFVDADARPNPGGYPVGGLTVVRFPDNHLVYALTWFALCALSLFFAWRLWRIRD